MYVKVDWRHSADELRALYQQEHDGKLRQRYQALWLLRQQRQTIEDIAGLLAVHPSTIIRWVRWYREGGLAELQAHRVGRAGGIAARMTLEEYAILAAYAVAGQFQTIDDVRRWVADYFGVTYTYWGMRSVLDRFKLHAKVPRPLDPQGDLEVHDLWKKGDSRTLWSPKASLPRISSGLAMRSGLPCMGNCRG